MSLTPGPTALTTPEKSRPGIRGNFVCLYSPRRTFQSAALTGVAATSITTSPALATGSGESRYGKTSGPPNRSIKAAFMSYLWCRLPASSALPAVRLVAQRGDRAELGRERCGAGGVERLQRRTRFAAVAAHGAQRRLEAADAAGLDELAQRRDAFLRRSRPGQPILAAELVHLLHQLGRHAGKGRDEPACADRRRRDQVLGAGDELEVRARPPRIGQKLDHELPVEAEIDHAGEVRQPVDQL